MSAGVRVRSNRSWARNPGITMPAVELTIPRAQPCVAPVHPAMARSEARQRHKRDDDGMAMEPTRPTGARTGPHCGRLTALIASGNNAFVRCADVHACLLSAAKHSERAPLHIDRVPRLQDRLQALTGRLRTANIAWRTPTSPRTHVWMGGVVLAGRRHVRATPEVDQRAHQVAPAAVHLPEEGNRVGTSIERRRYSLHTHLDH
jgi:hypothetical protein